MRYLFFLGGGPGNHPSYYSDVEGPADCGSGIFVAEEADVVGDNGSGNNTSGNVETPFMAILEDFCTRRIFLSCQTIRIFVGSAYRLKEF
jgi:hypothetical protein